MLEDGAEAEDGEARLEETEALFLMAKETFLCASASLGLSVVERRTGALICGLLLQPPRFMSSSDLREATGFRTFTCSGYLVDGKEI